jgi:hypothetical protein
MNNVTGATDADFRAFLVAKVSELVHLAIYKEQQQLIRDMVREELTRQLADSFTFKDVLKALVAEKTNA